jgi:hypothetical protein
VKRIGEFIPGPVRLVGDVLLFVLIPGVLLVAVFG